MFVCPFVRNAKFLQLGKYLISSDHHIGRHWGWQRVAGDGREWPGVDVGGKEWPGVAGDGQGDGPPTDFMREI